MLEQDIESEVLAISSKSEKILLEFLEKVLESSKLRGEQDIDKFLERHKNYQSAEITQEEYQMIKKYLKRENIEFAILKEQDTCKLCFKFGDNDKVRNVFDKLTRLKLEGEERGLKGLIKESLDKFKENKKTLEENLKVKEFTLDER